MKAIRVFLSTFLLMYALVVMLSCHGDNPVELIDNRNHLRTFLFGMHGFGPEEWFTASTSDPDLIRVIQEQLTLPEQERFLHIHGAIDRGNGGHNLRWSWYFVPNEWALVEVSIELCDGLPSDVEKNLDYWIKDVGYFCPWSSYVMKEL